MNDKVGWWCCGNSIDVGKEEFRPCPSCEATWIRYGENFINRVGIVKKKTRMEVIVKGTDAN